MAIENERSNLIEAELLHKLYRRGIWGGRHTPLKNLYHLCNPINIKDCKNVIKNLANQELIKLKNSTSEIHISLNPHKKKEIKDFICNILKIDSELLK